MPIRGTVTKYAADTMAKQTGTEFKESDVSIW
jgi:hypothetical protein